MASPSPHSPSVSKTLDASLWNLAPLDLLRSATEGAHVRIGVFPVGRTSHEAYVAFRRRLESTSSIDFTQLPCYRRQSELYRHMSWDNGRLFLDFCSPWDFSAEWSDFDASRKLFGVIGILDCREYTDLREAYAHYVQSRHAYFRQIAEEQRQSVSEENTTQVGSEASRVSFLAPYLSGKMKSSEEETSETSVGSSGLGRESQRDGAVVHANSIDHGANFPRISSEWSILDPIHVSRARRRRVRSWSTHSSIRSSPRVTFMSPLLEEEREQNGWDRAHTMYSNVSLSSSSSLSLPHQQSSIESLDSDPSSSADASFVAFERDPVFRGIISRCFAFEYDAQQLDVDDALSAGMFMIPSFADQLDLFLPTLLADVASSIFIEIEELLKSKQSQILPSLRGPTTFAPSSSNLRSNSSNEKVKDRNSVSQRKSGFYPASLSPFSSPVLTQTNSSSFSTPVSSHRFLPQTPSSAVSQRFAKFPLSFDSPNPVTSSSNSFDLSDASSRLSVEDDPLTESSFLLSPPASQAGTSSHSVTSVTHKRVLQARTEKWRGDHLLLMGAIADAFEAYKRAEPALRSYSDMEWLGATLEGMACCLLLQAWFVDSLEGDALDAAKTYLTRALASYADRKALMNFSSRAHFMSFCIDAFRGVQPDTFLSLSLCASTCLASYPARETIIRCIQLASICEKCQFLRKRAFFLRRAALLLNATDQPVLAIDYLYDVLEALGINACSLSSRCSKNFLDDQPEKSLDSKVEGRVWDTLRIQVVEEVIAITLVIGDHSLCARLCTYLIENYASILSRSKQEYLLSCLESAASQVPSHSSETVILSTLVEIVDICVSSISCSSHSIDIIEAIASYPSLTTCSPENSGANNVFIYCPFSDNELAEKNKLHPVAMWAHGERCSLRMKLTNHLKIPLVLQDLHLNVVYDAGESGKECLLACLIVDGDNDSPGSGNDTLYLPSESTLDFEMIVSPELSGFLNVGALSYRCLQCPSCPMLSMCSDSKNPGCTRVRVLEPLPRLDMSLEFPRFSQSSEDLFLGEEAKLYLLVKNISSVPAYDIEISLDNHLVSVLLDDGTQQEALDSKSADSDIQLEDLRHFLSVEDRKIDALAFGTSVALASLIASPIPQVAHSRTKSPVTDPRTQQRALQPEPINPMSPDFVSPIIDQFLLLSNLRRSSLNDAALPLSSDSFVRNTSSHTLSDGSSTDKHRLRGEQLVVYRVASMTISLDISHFSSSHRFSRPNLVPGEMLRIPLRIRSSCDFLTCPDSEGEKRRALDTLAKWFGKNTYSNGRNSGIRNLPHKNWIGSDGTSPSLVLEPSFVVQYSGLSNERRWTRKPDQSCSDDALDLHSFRIRDCLTHSFRLHAALDPIAVHFLRTPHPIDSVPFLGRMVLSNHSPNLSFSFRNSVRGNNSFATVSPCSTGQILLSRRIDIIYQRPSATDTGNIQDVQLDLCAGEFFVPNSICLQTVWKLSDGSSRSGSLSFWFLGDCYSMESCSEIKSYSNLRSEVDVRTSPVPLREISSPNENNIQEVPAFEGELSIKCLNVSPSSENSLEVLAKFHVSVDVSARKFNSASATGCSQRRVFPVHFRISILFLEASDIWSPCSVSSACLVSSPLCQTFFVEENGRFVHDADFSVLFRSPGTFRVCATVAPPHRDRRLVYPSMTESLGLTSVVREVALHSGVRLFPCDRGNRTVQPERENRPRVHETSCMPSSLEYWTVHLASDARLPHFCSHSFAKAKDFDTGWPLFCAFECIHLFPSPEHPYFSSQQSYCPERNSDAISSDTRSISLHSANSSLSTTISSQPENEDSYDELKKNDVASSASRVLSALAELCSSHSVVPLSSQSDRAFSAPVSPSIRAKPSSIPSASDFSIPELSGLPDTMMSKISSLPSQNPIIPLSRTRQRSSSTELQMMTRRLIQDRIEHDGTSPLVSVLSSNALIVHRRPSSFRSSTEGTPPVSPRHDAFEKGPSASKV